MRGGVGWGFRNISSLCLICETLSLLREPHAPRFYLLRGGSVYVIHRLKMITTPGLNLLVQLDLLST